MASTFDPSLIEATVALPTGLVDVYKLGGGDLQRAYIGTWAYRVRQHGETVASGTGFYTGLPATHQEVAAQVLDAVNLVNKKGR